MNKKKIWVFLLPILLFLFSVPTGIAQEKKVRVGYCDGYGILKKEEGHFTGYTYDYLVEIAQMNHWKLEFVPCGFEEGERKLVNGDIDIFGLFQKTPEREKKYDFTNLDLGSEYGVLYAAENNDAIFYGDPLSINGKKIGGVPNSYFKTILDNYCTANGIFVQYKPNDDFIAVNDAFKSGEVDLLLSTSLQELSKGKVVLSLGTNPIYLAVTKGNTAVLEGLNHGIEKLKKNNIYYEAELFSKHYKNNAISKTALTKEEAAYVKEHPTLKVMASPDLKPLSFYNQKTKTYEGIAIELLDKVAKNTGLTFDYVLGNSDPASKELKEQGKADSISIALNFNDIETQENIRLTQSYLDITMLLLSKGSNEIGEEPKIGVINTGGSDYLIKRLFPNGTVLYFDTVSQGIKALNSGVCDRLITSNYSYNQVMGIERVQDLQIQAIEDQRINVSMAVSSHLDPKLISILNKGIQLVSQEEKEIAITKNMVQFQEEINFWQYIKNNMNGILILLSISILFLMIILYFNHQKQLRRLEEVAYTDAMTGLENYESLKRKAPKFLKEPLSYSFVYLNIDGLKYINDRYGFKKGDDVLKYLGAALINFKKEKEIVCRMSEDKFGMLININAVDELKNRAGSFLEKLAHENQSPIKESLILKCGAYVLKAKDNNIEKIVDCAKIACDSIGVIHESHLVFFDNELRLMFLEEKKIQIKLKKALEAKEFDVFLQPKVNLMTGKTIGAEALIRWNHPLEGMISPGVFIPIAEKNGFVEKLDHFVWKVCFSTMEFWMDSNKPQVPISLNVSRVHLKSERFIRILSALKRSFHIPDGMIELELTEGIFIGNEEIKITLGRVDRLREDGFLLSMDDFGSGYSSLNLLKELPIDILKIDQGFLSQASSNVKGEIVIKHMVGLGKELGLILVAEGVESKEQADMLRDFGCHIAQGYYYGRPMPILEFEERLIKEAEEEKNKK